MKSIFLIIIICGTLVCQQAGADPITVVTDSGAYSHLDYGLPEGPWIDLVDAVMAEGGVEKYSVEIHPWARAYNTALKHKDTMILPLARTKSREHLFKWAGLIMPVRFFLVRRKDSSSVRVDSLESAKTYQIGVMRDDVSHEYLTDHQFPRLSFASKMDLLLKMLDGKRVDLICITRGSMAFVCRKNRMDCSDYVFEWEISGLSLDLYMAFNRETCDETVRQIAEGLERLKLMSTFTDIVERLKSE